MACADALAVAPDLGDDCLFVPVWSILEVRDLRSVGPVQVTPFGCTVERGICSAWVELTGELDLATAPVLHRNLREVLDCATLVVLDLRRLSFMDAAGLHVICDASERADAEDRRLMLLRGPAQVDRLFTLTGLSETLTISDVAMDEGSLAPIAPHLSVRDRRASPGAVTTTTSSCDLIDDLTHDFFLTAGARSNKRLSR